MAIDTQLGISQTHVIEYISTETYGFLHVEPILEISSYLHTCHVSDNDPLMTPLMHILPIPMALKVANELTFHTFRQDIVQTGRSSCGVMYVTNAKTQFG